MKKIVLSGALVASVALAGAGFTSLSAASGSTLSVSVKDQNGMPVRDAVVLLYPKSGASRSIRFPWSNTMNQHDLEFKPGTLIVPKGATVAFPNRDKVRHNVYSFSKAARFELKLYGRDQSRSHRFPVAGAVALGCNIHDQMRGYIRVSDTPYAAKTDHNGRLQLSSLPGGAATMVVWHPRNRVRGGDTKLSVAIRSGSNNKSVALKIR